MADINNIKDKIKKLLALSADNPSDAESHAAFAKAQELMAQYKLEKSDLTEEEKKNCIKKKTILTYGIRSSDHYRNELAEIIANNFCCVNYISTIRGTRTHTICFMGMEDDVDIAIEVLYAADEAIIRGYNRVWKKACEEYDVDYLPAKYFNPLKTGYIEGYLAGFKNVMQTQKDEHQEWGLVMVVPQEAQNFINNIEHTDFSTPIYVDNTYFEDGYNDGKNFHLNKKVEGGEPVARLN